MNSIKYEIIIEKFANSFELELSYPYKYNISKCIVHNKNNICDDINLLIRFAYLLRNGKAKIIIDEDN